MINTKVIMAPFSVANPYQKLLSQHLEEIGVKVEGVKRISYSLVGKYIKNKPDIIHLHWLHPFFLEKSTIKSTFRMITFLSKLIILKAIGTKIIWTTHNLNAHDNHNLLLLDRICTFAVTRLAHAIIAHCQVAECEIVTQLGLKNKEKIFVVPHGNYVDYYENTIDRAQGRELLSISDSSLMFLFLGTIRPYKGVIELIKIFKELKKDTAQLVVAGNSLDDSLTELINQEIENVDNIKFIPGFVPDDRIQVYMNACDAVIFPYQDILTSGAVLLAMSFGRACIAINKGCIGETLDELGAFLYEPNEDKNLLTAINQAIQKQADLLAMGAHNRQIVEQWNWKYVAKKTLQVYES